MPCQNPTVILSPESRFLKKCRKEHRSYEYYLYHANERRNVIYDPLPLIQDPDTYYSVNPFNDYRVMTVPCGKCELCLKSRVDGYVVRNYFEWLHTVHACNGSSWFITLTYADELLPIAIPKNGPYRPTPCFSKYHIQTFLKRFRKLSGLDFKYFIVTEFGGEFGRPHYHAVFHIKDFKYSPSNHYKLLHWIAKSWTKINDRRFFYAMSEVPDLFDVQRVDVQNIVDFPQVVYCCKYVGKQVAALDFDKLDIPEDNKRFHLQSIGLGDRIFDYCNKDLWEKGFISVNGFNYSIPIYYKNLVMKEFMCEESNGTIVYRPTEFKYNYLSGLCEYQIEMHKKLSLLNSDYPSPPEWTYDPLSLSRFLGYLANYAIFRTPPEDDFLLPLYDSWALYLLKVQNYHKSEFEAKALQYKKKQYDHYLKKTGRKRK